MSATLAASTPVPEKPVKIYYIDHLKVVLTVLVVLHHTAVTYGAPGGWYYAEKSTKLGAIIPMTLFVAVNQAFFMGFFFFLSSYFIKSSYDRKGPAKFIIDRLLRLGLPLVFYSFVFSPFLSYLVYNIGYGHHITYLQFLSGFDDWIDFGVLWFVAALLIFTLAYAALQRIFKGSLKQLKVPATGTIILFAAITGLVSFLVRINLPVGLVWKPLGFQPSHFTQYISMFILGLLAFKNNWLRSLPFKTGKQLAKLAIILILLFPIFYVIKLKTGMPVEWFSGGFHWQQLLYAVWEQIVGYAIITALLAFGKHYWNNNSQIQSKLSRYTFAVYIFHPLIVISVSLGARNWSIDPGLKFLIVAPLAVIGSFLLARVITVIPGVKKII